VIRPNEVAARVSGMGGKLTPEQMEFLARLRAEYRSMPDFVGMDTTQQGAVTAAVTAEGTADAAQYARLKAALRVEELQSHGFYKAASGRTEADFISPHAYSRHQFTLNRTPNQNRTQFDENVDVARLRVDTMNNPDRAHTDPHTGALAYEKKYQFDIAPSNLVDPVESPASSQSSRVHKVYVNPDPNKSTQFPVAPRHGR
jgi:hypothetical protein